MMLRDGFCVLKGSELQWPQQAPHILPQRCTRNTDYTQNVPYQEIMAKPAHLTSKWLLCSIPQKEQFMPENVINQPILNFAIRPDAKRYDTQLTTISIPRIFSLPCRL